MRFFVFVLNIQVQFGSNDPLILFLFSKTLLISDRVQWTVGFSVAGSSPRWCIFFWCCYRCCCCRECHLWFGLFHTSSADVGLRVFFRIDKRRSQMRLSGADSLYQKCQLKEGIFHGCLLWSGGPLLNSMLKESRQLPGLSEAGNWNPLSSKFRINQEIAIRIRSMEIKTSF